MANKRSREVAKRADGDITPAASPANPGWDLDGMDEQQRSEAEAIQARVLSRPRRVIIRVETKEKVRTLAVGDGSEPAKTLHSMRFMETTGSRSNDFANDLLSRLATAVALTGDNKRDSERLSAAMALVSGISPQDEMEATIALQMVAANEAALMFFERARTAQYMEHAAPYSNMANKAMRSFALHAEALAKLRRGGEQVVKHVHVNEGGQALIAGTVNTGGRG